MDAETPITPLGWSTSKSRQLRVGCALSSQSVWQSGAAGTWESRHREVCGHWGLESQTPHSWRVMWDLPVLAGGHRVSGLLVLGSPSSGGGRPGHFWVWWSPTCQEGWYRALSTPSTWSAPSRYVFVTLWSALSHLYICWLRFRNISRAFQSCLKRFKCYMCPQFKGSFAPNYGSPLPILGKFLFQTRLMQSSHKSFHLSCLVKLWSPSTIEVIFWKQRRKDHFSYPLELLLLWDVSSLNFPEFRTVLWMHPTEYRRVQPEIFVWCSTLPLQGCGRVYKYMLCMCICPHGPLREFA